MTKARHHTCLRGPAADALHEAFNLSDELLLSLRSAFMGLALHTETQRPPDGATVPAFRRT